MVVRRLRLGRLVMIFVTMIPYHGRRKSPVSTLSRYIKAKKTGDSALETPLLLYHLVVGTCLRMCHVFGPYATVWLVDKKVFGNEIDEEKTHRKHEDV